MPWRPASGGPQAQPYWCLLVLEAGVPLRIGKIQTGDHYPEILEFTKPPPSVHWKSGSDVHQLCQPHYCQEGSSFWNAVKMKKLLLHTNYRQKIAKILINTKRIAKEVQNLFAKRTEDTKCSLLSIFNDCTFMVWYIMLLSTFSSILEWMVVFISIIWTFLFL